MRLETLMLAIACASIVIGTFVWVTAFMSKRNAEGREFESVFRPDDDNAYLPNSSELEWRRKMIDEQNERGW